MSQALEFGLKCRMSTSLESTLVEARAYTLQTELYSEVFQHNLLSLSNRNLLLLLLEIKSFPGKQMTKRKARIYEYHHLHRNDLLIFSIVHQSVWRL